MRDEGVADPRQHSTASSPEVADRRSRPDRRGEADRRRGGDRRRSGDRRDARDADLLLAELEMRVAAAIRQSGGLIEGDGSGWDKLIVPCR